MALAAAVMDTWLPEAQRSLAVGLMVDGSTTVSREEGLISYLRYLHNGVSTVRFWKIVSVPDGTASTIFKVLTSAFSEDDIDVAFVFSLSTDGASNMLGCHSGECGTLRKNRDKGSWKPNSPAFCNCL